MPGNNTVSIYSMVNDMQSLSCDTSYSNLIRTVLSNWQIFAEIPILPSLNITSYLWSFSNPIYLLICDLICFLKTLFLMVEKVISPQFGYIGV